MFLPEFPAEKLSHTFKRATRPNFPRNFEKSARKMLSQNVSPLEIPFKRARRPNSPRNFEKSARKMLSQTFPPLKILSKRARRPNSPRNFEKSARKMLSQTFSTGNRIQTGEKTQNIHKILRKVPGKCCLKLLPVKKLKFPRKFWEKYPKMLSHTFLLWKSHWNRCENSNFPEILRKITQNLKFYNRKSWKNSNLLVWTKNY